MKNFWNAVKNIIGLNDIWLAVFFIILLVNLVLCMVFPLPENDMKTGLDIVTRTAIAILSGYFISKNFIEKKPLTLQDKEKQTRHAFQSTIIALIGLFSISLIISVRFDESINFSPTTLSQVRDLFLVSIAFLMGTAKE